MRYQSLTLQEICFSSIYVFTYIFLESVDVRITTYAFQHAGV